MTDESSIKRSMADLVVGQRAYRYFPLEGIPGASTLPYTLTILLENVLRCGRTDEEAALYASRILEAAQAGSQGKEVEFSPARVLFQDFTGVPVFVDFAAMRDACKALGGDPSRINPLVPCDLVIDHSVIADEAGTATALGRNESLEFQRNRERYDFLKWAQRSFDNVRIVPPGGGICHQLDIEILAEGVWTAEGVGDDGEAEAPLVYFDTVVGTDSHTPTVNGIGVLGWGVGGIEAEAAALGQPITILVPPVVGVELSGSLQPGVSAMDVALTFAEMLRGVGVVGAFVECFGEGVGALSATQRSCISNMTPEYGCTCTLFPIDELTLEYLRLTGRSEQTVALVEAYAKAQSLWNDGRPRAYAKTLTFDLSSVRPSAAGPSRPHDRVDRAALRDRFRDVLEERHRSPESSVTVELDGASYDLADGTVAIAAVTSCTTATDPSMMLACGLIARNAAAAGLKAKPWVKTILAPGSHGTERLLARAGLLEGLQALGFYICGFGCMSCIGNSGPLPSALHEASQSIELVSVLSGNRNFEGRISPDVSQNYLMAPAAVVAYALAGTVDIDMESEPLGFDPEGNPVYLRDLWPREEEIEALLDRCVDESLYAEGLAGLFDGNEAWRALPGGDEVLFPWDGTSTYVRRAPYFDSMEMEPTMPEPVTRARILALLGDFVTTDHISPAGAFAAETPAGRYLIERAIEPADFNTYGSRRGNHEVMARGTFANVKLANLLAEGRKGGWTYDFIQDAIAPIFEAARSYEEAGEPAVILAGKMYGSGSSRDWAAKGPQLLGVKAVIAESYERIHRSNLIGMGILPLQFKEGESAATLGFKGNERITIGTVDPNAIGGDPLEVEVQIERPDGSVGTFEAIVRIDTPTEGDYYFHGGILPYVLRSLI